MKFITIVILVALNSVIGIQLFAADYYVATGGSNSNAGSISSPWETVAYGISGLSGGDTLIIRKGLYRETYLAGIPSGIDSDNYTQIKAYDGEEVIISSMSDASGTSNWELVSNGVYKYLNASVTTYRHLSIDGIPMRLMVKYNDFAGASIDINGEGQWSRNKDSAGIWVKAPGGVNPGSLNVEITYCYKGIEVESNKSYIKLSNLTIEGGYYPIHIEGDYIDVSNCTFRNCYGDGIKVGGWTAGMDLPSWDSEYGVIENCDIYYFGESGIDITGGDYWQINNTLIHDGVYTRYDNTNNGQKLNGIMLKNNNIGTVVNACRIFNFDAAFGAITLGGSTSVETLPAAVDLIAMNNIIHDMNAPYIVTFTGSEDCIFTNNIIYDCDTSDSMLIGNTQVDALIQMRCSDSSAVNEITCSGVTIMNNIFYNNTADYIYRETVDGSDIDAVIDYNYISNTRDSYFDGSSITFSSMQSTKGYDDNAITGTPSFMDWSKRLIRLADDGFGIEDGTPFDVVADDYDFQSRIINNAIDVGPYENNLFTVYSDGTSTDGWVVPSGQTISSVSDSTLNSYVLQTTGSSFNTYWLLDENLSSWDNDSQFAVSWKAKYSAAHSFQVRFATKENGMKTIKFYSNYSSPGPHTSTLYRFPLNTGSSSTEDEEWHNYSFDLVALLASVAPTEEIDYIERFYVSGGGYIDDIELHNKLETAKIPTGLVGEWKLNEGNGAYTEDTSGLYRHGALQNLSDADPADNCWKLGTNLKALVFDKSSHKAVIAPEITESFANGFTLSAIVQFDNIDSSYDVITSGLQGNSVYGRLYEQNGYIHLQIKVDSGQFLSIRTVANAFEAQKWVNVTARCDIKNGTMRIFINGIDKTDMTRYNYSFTATALDTGSSDLYIGSSSTGSVHSFEGAIDDVKLFNRPLMDEEILFISDL
jgi:Concanavalin A-like lectin/glucanases superfamily/Right handed beta helix region